MNETQELILQRLGELARLFPQQRLGQILYNYFLVHCPNNDPFYIEDKDFLAIVEQKVIETANKVKEFKERGE